MPCCLIPQVSFSLSHPAGKGYIEDTKAAHQHSYESLDKCLRILSLADLEACAEPFQIERHFISAPSILSHFPSSMNGTSDSSNQQYPPICIFNLLGLSVIDVHFLCSVLILLCVFSISRINDKIKSREIRKMFVKFY